MLSLYESINLKKDHSMIETCRLKNVVIFIQTILSFVLSRIITFCFLFVCVVDLSQMCCTTFSATLPSL